MTSLLQRLLATGASARASATLDHRAYSPYAEKWKEFDRLELLAHIPAWSDWVMAAIAVAVSVIFGEAIRTVGFRINLAIVLVGALALRMIRNRAGLLEHWPCPRCGAEWPGTKTEKDSKCAMCGLGLHQLTP